MDVVAWLAINVFDTEDLGQIWGKMEESKDIE